MPVNHLDDADFSVKFANFSKKLYIIGMVSMNIEEQVFLAISYRGTNLAAIAREMGMSRQNLHLKIRRNTLKKEELCKIGKILGAKYVSYCSFPGGVVIGDRVKRGRGKSGSGKSKVS